MERKLIQTCCKCKKKIKVEIGNIFFVDNGKIYCPICYIKLSKEGKATFSIDELKNIYKIIIDFLHNYKRDHKDVIIDKDIYNISILPN